MVVSEMKHVNPKVCYRGKQNLQFYLVVVFQIWNDYWNIFAAEFDVNRELSFYYINNFLRKTNISESLKPTSLYAYQKVININFSENFVYLIEKKSRQKMTNFFLPVTNFFADYFFYERLISTNEYSYRHFFTNERI